MLGSCGLFCRVFFFHFGRKTTRPDPARPSPARPGPARPVRQKNEEEKSSFLLRLVKNIDFEIFTQKSHDSSRKIIKKVGQFYVTLICSLDLRKNRMILAVKISKIYVTFTTSTRVFMYTFQSYSEQRVRGL